MDPSTTGLDALVVLGCKTRSGQPSPALERRLQRARRAQRDWGVPRVLMSGGKAWEGHREAQVMGDWWRAQDERRADPELELLLELDSLTTKQNAACAAQLLLPRGLRRIGLVTCDFHMARARRCFVRRGFDVEPLPAASGSGLGRKLRLWSRERIAILLSAFEVEP